MHIDRIIVLTTTKNSVEIEWKRNKLEERRMKQKILIFDSKTKVNWLKQLRFDDDYYYCFPVPLRSYAKKSINFFLFYFLFLYLDFEGEISLTHYVLMAKKNWEPGNLWFLYRIFILSRYILWNKWAFSKNHTENKKKFFGIGKTIEKFIILNTQETEMMMVMTGEEN